MSFLDQYKKDMAKNKDISVEVLEEPEYFLHSGSYSLNKLMSGRMSGAIPQGRLIALGGHASSGKSLVAASIMGQALKAGGYAIAVDSEGALDRKYLENCGVDVDSPKFTRIGTSMIQKASSVVNKFIQAYRDSGETDPVVIVVDSLDMLLTDSEAKSVDQSGELGGDQGQRAKQTKRMLMSWVHPIEKLPITIICTKQVYQEQDQAKAYANPWVFTKALEYPFSQIIIFEKLVYKDEKTKEHLGFTMKATSYKNRFAEEKQVVKVEVPYKNGLDPYAGILEIAEEYDVIRKGGAWIYFGEEKFQGKAKLESDPDAMERILQAVIAVDNPDRQVHADLDDYIAESENPGVSKETAKSRRKAKALEGLEDDDNGEE